MLPENQTLPKYSLFKAVFVNFVAFEQVVRIDEIGLLDAHFPLQPTFLSICFIFITQNSLKNNIRSKNSLI